MKFTLVDPLDVEWSPDLTKLEAESLKAQQVLNRRRERRVATVVDDVQSDPLKKDFRAFLARVWTFLNLPPPSGVQQSLAWWLQNGPSRAVILGFRGMAKSWITGAYILWKLYCNPQTKILVVSASLDRAVQTVQWCLALIREMPELQHLQPGTLQRQSGKQFDVGPALPDQSPSLRGAGITGQITGSRAHLIVPDDVEIPANSMTVAMREKIAEVVKEFDAILHPGGEVKFLGTPQCDDSLYPKLGKRGYTLRIWPSEYPDRKQRIKYGEKLSPYILNKVEADPSLVGHSVWPERFTDDDLAGRKLSYGRSGYALQFLLDTSLSDADRYPLKLYDLIVMDLDLERGPDVVAWGRDPKNVVQGLPMLGFEGDHYYGPASMVDVFSPWSQVIMSLDPSGRGGDETSATVLAELHARVFMLAQGAWRDGYSPTTLKAIAQMIVTYKVRRLVIEDNFGDGMFVQLITPYVIAAWKDFNERRPVAMHLGTSIEGVRSPRTQKELRILGALEPVTQSHRLVVAKRVIEDDYKSLQSIDGDDIKDRYSFAYQYSHLTRERDALLHDDRLESLALGVAQFADLLGINPWTSAEQREEERMDEELMKLLGEDPTGDGGPRETGRPSAVRGTPGGSKVH